MTPKELVALARSAASRHQLYPEIVCAIIEQESAWNPWAIRYEPAFYDRYILPLRSRGEITHETEARARATSWGLMQVMGQVARETGFAKAFLSELCDPIAGIETGCAVFDRKLAAAEGNVARALLLWNGGGNSHYAAEVLSRAGEYRSS
jgi:soluble lytic murein transglycosylase-like protein